VNLTASPARLVMGTSIRREICTSLGFTSSLPHNTRKDRDTVEVSVKEFVVNLTLVMYTYLVISSVSVILYPATRYTLYS